MTIEPRTAGTTPAGIIPAGAAATEGWTVTARWAAADAAVLVGRGLRHLVRDPETLLLSVILPVNLMLLFVYVFGGAIDTGGDYVDYVVPGIILLCAGYGAAATAVGVAQDTATGVIDRFRSLPISAGAVLTGHVVASVARNAVSTALVVAVALATGFRPDATAVEWCGVIVVLLLFVLAMTWLSVALGLLAGSSQAASGFTFFVLFLPYLSSAFVPTGTMPGPLRAVADHQPVTPVIETLRGLLTGTPIGTSGWLALAWFGPVLAGSYLAAKFLFGWRAFTGRAD
ncbi:ABC transporter permease [Parafrankia discariae]|uniref:ABC transporter permease n=1 Tax=Parafrankia discariae TaxID=365528 RepID=UPI0003749470|nr:ABC transporter permease [Parafrankia discariae]